MIKVSDTVLKFLVDNCVNLDLDAIKAQEESVGKKDNSNVHNSKGQANWDSIYNNIVNKGESFNITPLKINRGGIWTAIGAYHEPTKELFLLFRLPNLKKIMKRPFRGHYATLANVGNGNIKAKQQEWDLSMNVERERILEYEYLSEDLFQKMGVVPKKIILCGFTPFEFRTFVYNKSQRLAWEENYSYLIDAQYTGLSGEQYEVNPPAKDSNNKNFKKKEPKKRIRGLKKI